MAMNIYRAAANAAKIGVQKHTVKTWSLNGKFPDRRTPAGYRCHTDADVERYLGVERAPPIRAQRQAMETFCPGTAWR